MGKRYYYGVRMYDTGDVQWVVRDSWTNEDVADGSFAFGDEQFAASLCDSLNEGHAAAVANDEPVAGNDTSN